MFGNRVNSPVLSSWVYRAVVGPFVRVPKKRDGGEN